MFKAQYILVGGFLGAGKTTAILKMAQLMRSQGQRVGLITNDQSYGLVDTAMLGSAGFAVEEITGGCFCCRFNSLVEAAEKLSAEGVPDVFIAEPVGSCTDLKATVDYPLRRIYGDDYRIAPLSVLVDPIRAMRVVGLDHSRTFSEKVLYIYRKQLEEAEVIVVNKSDLLTAEQLAALRQALGEQFPAASVSVISARLGEGIDEWVRQITSSSVRVVGAMDVDYETYADGEALLGWVNCTLSINSRSASFDGNRLLLELIDSLKTQLMDQDIEIAHLKMTLAPDDNGNDIGVANWVQSSRRPELSHSLQEELDSGQMIINLRAEADPAALAKVVKIAVDALGATRAFNLKVDHLESFRPGKPVPTHRLAEV